MTGTLSGKRALVTGAARRLGRHLALSLAREGADVIVHYRSSEDAARAVASEIEGMGRRAELARADLGDADGANGLVRQVDALDILVNNVGNYPVTPLEQSSAQEWHDTLATNVIAPHVLISGLADRFPSAGGAIVNIGYAGVENLRPNTEATAYQVSKTGLLILTKSYAAALAGRGIRVNMVSPGQLDISVDLPDDLATSIPLGRAGTLEDVAVVVRMLVQPASYVTGVNIDVAGGYRL